MKSTIALVLAAGLAAVPASAAEVMRCSANGIDPPSATGPLYCILGQEKDPSQTTLQRLYDDGWRIAAATRAPADARNPTDRWWFYMERLGS